MSKKHSCKQPCRGRISSSWALGLFLAEHWFCAVSSELRTPFPPSTSRCLLLSTRLHSSHLCCQHVLLHLLPSGRKPRSQNGCLSRQSTSRSHLFHVGWGRDNNVHETCTHGGCQASVCRCRTCTHGRCYACVCRCCTCMSMLRLCVCHYCTCTQG